MTTQQRSIDHPALRQPRMVPEQLMPETLRLRVALRFEAVDEQVYEPRGNEPMTIPAATRGTWVLTVTNEHSDIQEGGLISFCVYNIQLAHRFQCTRPRCRDYATLSTDSDAQLALVPFGPVVAAHVLVESGTFAVGERFTLRLGDRSAGGPGSEAFWSATDAEIRTVIDPTGDCQFRESIDNPQRIRITHRGELDLLRVLGPTVAGVDEPFDLHVIAFDQCRNIVTDHTGRVRCDLPKAVRDLPSELRFDGSEHGVKIIKGVRFSQPGVHRLRMRTATGVEAISHPIVVQRDPAMRMLWGDMHCHGWGDTTMYQMRLRTQKMDPYHRHVQARDVGRFDWAAPGPMSLPAGEADVVWQAWVEAHRKIDEPGRYIPFLSFENHPPEGDRQVIFREGGEPCPGHCRHPVERMHAMYGQRDDALLQVHIGGAAPDWSRYAPAREAMVEVASGFGNAEWLLQDALQRGYRPGVAGASDAHLGLLGAPRAIEPMRGRFAFRAAPMNQRDTAFGAGPITAVRAPACERDAIWSGMKRGSTYATTGARIYL
ncbi:MAG: DUF3604 domain-containing protein, partial [Phycisphaeraceae bacterium]